MLITTKNHKATQKTVSRTLLFIFTFTLPSLLGLDIIRAQPPPHVSCEKQPSQFLQQKLSNSKDKILPISPKSKKNTTPFSLPISMKGKSSVSEKIGLDKNIANHKLFFISQNLPTFSFSELKFQAELFAQVPYKNLRLQERSPPSIF